MSSQSSGPVVKVEQIRTAGRIERMLNTERGDPSVPVPNWEPLPRSAVFDAEGLPRPEVVKEHFKREGLLSEADALEIITRCAMLWKDEPNVRRLEDPVVICGDIHGQFFDLLQLLELGGDPATQKYIFLGDYVDRGCFGMEVILLLMCYKIRYPASMVMLRGNHESRHLTAYFNFKREVLYKYSLAVYNAMMSAFDCIPLVCILNNRFMCVHGGLSPELKRVADINAIHRFREPPSTGPMCDLLWADPMDEKEGDPSSPASFATNTTRGCSYVYSHAAACKFLEANDLVSVIRGHEAQDDGFHLYKRSTKGFPAIICVFSAPNYCDTYDNRAAIVILNKSVMNIKQFNSSPHPYYLPNFMNAFSWSLPFVAEKLLDIWSNILMVIEEEEETALSPVLDKPIKIKIMAIAMLSRMFRTLREHNESIVELKGLAGGSIPQGALRSGPEGIRRAIRGFHEARELDRDNERWPATPLETELTTEPNAVTKALNVDLDPTGESALAPKR